MRYRYKDYNFIKVGKYQIWRNWYFFGYHIRLEATRLSGFKTSQDARDFIKEYL